MSETKVETGRKVSAVEESNGSLPIAQKNSVREEIKKSSPDSMSADSIELIPGETRLNPQQLMKMYMLGKLTMGQLTSELRKFNDVVADNIIKDGKQNFTQVVDYKGVGRPSVSNPGSDMTTPKDEKQAPPPRNAKDAKKEAKDTDNDKKKKDLEKKEDHLKKNEALITVRQVNLFTKDQEEQKNQQLSLDAKQKEKKEEEEYQQLGPDSGPIDKAMKKGSLRDTLRKNASEEIRRELEKLKSGPSAG